MTNQIEPIIKYRGAILPEKILPRLLVHDYSFVKEQKMGYYFSYETPHFQFHVVDRFASFPLFYYIRKGKLYVSEKISDIISYLPEIKFDATGYYTTGGLLKGERSERTPFEGIKRLMPGHYITSKNGHISITRYWSFLDLKDCPFQGTYEESCEELGYLIQQAVRRSYDFAPDAALHFSGGLDSGSIAALTCQLSDQPRRAYTYVHPDAPLNHDYYESGFIDKYKKHFPNLEITYFSKLSKVKKNIAIFPDAENWYTLSLNKTEFTVIKEAINEKKKYIFTGLGGDELASYGHGFQNVRYSIHNDQQAKLYMKWIIHEKRRLKGKLKILLGKIQVSRADAMHAYKLGRIIGERKFWYTKQFQSAASEVFQLPTISLYLFPSSYTYRLETLNRAFFTIRSDRWNFMGRKMGVDYLHPLLDADLVTFCATLPRSFFRNRKHREMIKTALAPYLPNDLLIGGKRPSMLKPPISEATLLDDSLFLQHSLKKMEKTFASTVYDFEAVENQHSRIQNFLEKSTYKQKASLKSIEKWNRRVRMIIEKAMYLNNFFG